MSKNRKRTCWVFQVDYEVYGDRNTEIQLFSNKKKAQEALIKEWANDIKNCGIERYDIIEYKDQDGEHNDVISTAVINNQDIPDIDWVSMWQQYDSDFINYSIYKKEIK